MGCRFACWPIRTFSSLSNASLVEWAF